jgi:hypothetical protein
VVSRPRDGRDRRSPGVRSGCVRRFWAFGGRASCGVGDLRSDLWAGRETRPQHWFDPPTTARSPAPDGGISCGAEPTDYGRSSTAPPFLLRVLPPFRRFRSRLAQATGDTGSR